MSISETKLVSIGIPVLNGDKYLSRCIESVLKQSYPYLEIVVSDNCSNDRTAELCQRFAACDERIHCVRQERTISFIDNFRFCVEAARGHYFAWVAHDDWLSDSDYIAKLVKHMELNPDVVCATSDVKREDEAGYHVGTVILNDLRGERSWQTVRRNIFAWSARDALHAIYGLYRREVLLACPLDLRRIGGMEVAIDLETPFLAKIALHGRIVSLPFLGRVQTLLQKSIAHEERATFHWKLKKKIDRAHDVYLLLLVQALYAKISSGEKLSIIAACVLGIFKKFRIQTTVLRTVRQTIKRLGFRVHRIHSNIRQEYHHGTFDQFVKTHFSNDIWQLMPRQEKEIITFYQPLFAVQAVRHVLACGLEEREQLDVLEKHYPHRHFYLADCQFAAETPEHWEGSFRHYVSGCVQEMIPAFISDQKNCEDKIVPVDLLLFSYNISYSAIVQWINKTPSCQAFVINYRQNNGIIDSDYHKIIKYSIDEGFSLFSFGPQVFDPMIQAVSGKILLTRI